MNIYLTLDYELFFGLKSGTVEKAIIEPTEALLKLVDPYKIKINCFVDSGYLVRLEAQKKSFPQLERDYQKVASQIKHLADNGHGIELHIHPHWEDSYYDGEKWVFDTTRYKLSDFNRNEIMDITTRYTEILTRITGINPKAFRAGGWSAQPFNKIKDALAANKIFIDSTVFPKGVYHSNNQSYDFSNVPKYKTSYRFSDELTAENSLGEFTEIPISSHSVSPAFFWKLAWHKIFKSKYHQTFGDGSPIRKHRRETLRLMTSNNIDVVSMDGYKASLIQKAYNKYKFKTDNKENFVVIGHPKAFTPYSLNMVAKFIDNVYAESAFVTFQNQLKDL